MLNCRCLLVFAVSLTTHASSQIWSDSDSIWLRNCSTRYLADHLLPPLGSPTVPTVDIIGACVRACTSQCRSRHGTRPIIVTTVATISHIGYLHIAGCFHTLESPPFSSVDGLDSAMSPPPHTHLLEEIAAATDLCRTHIYIMSSLS